MVFSPIVSFTRFCVGEISTGDLDAMMSTTMVKVNCSANGNAHVQEKAATRDRQVITFQPTKLKFRPLQFDSLFPISRPH
jgi:hypothetical protein